MHAYCLNPQGVLTHLDLDAIPIKRLELGATRSMIGVGIRYVSSGTTSLMFLAAIDTGSTGNECAGIARIGLPRDGIAANKERLTESMKILHNSDIQSRKVDEFISESPKLVDVYYDAMKAIMHGADAGGTLGGWKWVIQSQRTPVEFIKSDSPGDQVADNSTNGSGDGKSL